MRAVAEEKAIALFYFKKTRNNMTTVNRRYYWLRLKEDFFTDKRIKRLRRISGGETYTIIYLKLLLLSLKNEGNLYFQQVDETFPKELALVLDETGDDIAVTLNYLLKVNLIETIESDETSYDRNTEFNRL